MPRYEVRISSPAEKDLRRLDRGRARRLLDRVTELGNERVEKLAGFEDVYRIRVGDLRIVYQIRDAILLVLVVAVASRGSVRARVKRRLP